MSKLEKQIGEAIGKELLNKHQKRMDYIKDNKKKYESAEDNFVYVDKDRSQEVDSLRNKQIGEAIGKVQEYNAFIELENKVKTITDYVHAVDCTTMLERNIQQSILDKFMGFHNDEINKPIFMLSCTFKNYGSGYDIDVSFIQTIERITYSISNGLHSSNEIRLDSNINYKFWDLHDIDCFDTPEKCSATGDNESAMMPLYGIFDPDKGMTVNKVTITQESNKTLFLLDFPTFSCPKTDVKNFDTCSTNSLRTFEVGKSSSEIPNWKYAKDEFYANLRIGAQCAKDQVYTGMSTIDFKVYPIFKTTSEYGNLIDWKLAGDEDLISYSYGWTAQGTCFYDYKNHIAPYQTLPQFTGYLTKEVIPKSAPYDENPLHYLGILPENYYSALDIINVEAKMDSYCFS